MTARIREATGGDADAASRLLDAAMLEFDRERVRRRTGVGSALVAVAADVRDAAEPSDERVVGICVLSDAGGGDGASGIGTGEATDGTGEATAEIDDSATEIEQIAVHQSRRGRGIGRDLVEAAADRADGVLITRFPAGVRPFYESLGFEIRETDWDGDRLLGVRQ